MASDERGIERCVLCAGWEDACAFCHIRTVIDLFGGSEADLDGE